MSFKKKFDESEFIEDINLISSNHFMVTYRNRNYVDIFNMFTSELVVRKKFKTTVAHAIANSFKKEVNFTTNYNDTQSMIAIVLKGGELHVFNLIRTECEEEKKYDLKFSKQTENKIDFEEVFNNLCHC